MARLPLLLIVFAAVGLPIAADELRTVNNKSIKGSIVSMDDKEVVLKTADGDIVSTPLEDVIAVNLGSVKKVPAGTTYTDIRLVDDSILLCEQFTIKGTTLEATLLGGQTVAVPVANVASILRGPHDAELMKQWNALMANKVKRDRVVIYKGGKVNDLPGTIGDADAGGAKIKFRTVEGDSLDVPIANLQGMIFYRSETNTRVNPVCMVYDKVGNALAAAKITSDETRVVIVATIPNLKIELEKSAIARFDFNMGKLAFLSDMTPTEVIEKSGLGFVVAHRKDTNLEGEPIILDRSYSKGLALHAHTELEYDLKGKYRKFTAVLGVDTRVGPDSQPKVVIEVDGKTAFSQIITAKAVVPITINVTSAHSLRIIVKSRDFTDLLDHVTIANPKVTQ